MYQPSKLSQQFTDRLPVYSHANSSRFEAWLVSAHKAFNTDHLLFTHVCGYTLHIEEMSKVHDLEFLQGLFRIVARMKQLQLTTEEECILKGMSILSGDRCSQEKSSFVEQCQAEMVQCMAYKLRQTHPRRRHMLPRVISLLTDLRTLSELHRKQEEKIGMEWSSDIKFPPLLYEIFSNY
ncbi:hypothetical protein LSH36_449g02001 [Paralvinella palmiformis]|uniref:NR LBD domain-containing protein n=1 Tax=Paralvinella palmiformis TaxID=53620 RepID=A0AAD9MXJ3_9ANNE|nr:hypothetical protein LSH36_449g02001 [Paralvinella palmiformis]